MRTRLLLTNFTLGFATIAALPITTAAAVNSTAKTVNVLYAGSMTRVMEEDIAPNLKRTMNISLVGEAAGSSQLAHLIATGQQQADLFISASPSVIKEDLMGAKNHSRATWYATLAGDSLVIAYNPRSRFARALSESNRGGKPWYRVLATPGLRLGRTDPQLDPKGAATLVMMALAEKVYHLPHLSAQLLGAVDNPSQVFPEEDLLARLQTGQLDAVVAYRHEAVEWGMPYVRLPGSVNLGDPAFASDYAATHVKVQQSVKSGSLIEFALTIPTGATHPNVAAQVARDLLAGHARQMLLRQGFTAVHAQFFGNVKAIPAELKSLTGRAVRTDQTKHDERTSP